MSAPGVEPLGSPPPRGALAGEEPPLVALIGRPNCGKSSLYNAVTGGDAHVGNFPGITVDILESRVTLPGGGAAQLADLPGLYSIEAVVDRSTDEGVARTFVEQAAAAGRELLVAQVIDATRLALGLRLTRELLGKSFPLLVIVTQEDVLRGEGRVLDPAVLEDALGVPVVAVSARDAATRARVLDAMASALREGRAPSRARGSAHFDAEELAARAIREPAALSHEAERRRTFTTRADAVLLHPLLGPILFLGVMALLFAAVFLVADPATAALDYALGALRTRLASWLGSGLVGSFVADGLLGGAGTVLAFMPQIVILTVAMELLEASGYLARGAFLLDRVLRLLGLSGRSFLPLLMGHACAVPAISSTRIIRDPRERLTTILVLPLMTCSARIPTYALVLSTFFAGRGVWFRALIFVALYFAGVLFGLLASFVLRRSATKGRTLPLVLEMPAYRAPQPRVVLRKGARAAGRFLRDVGTVILAVSAVLWVLLTVPLPGRGVGTSADPQVSAETSRIESSIAAGVGKALVPVTAPIGFDWRINVGLIGSFGAREVMVGTMGVIFGIEGAEDDPSPLSERMREAKGPGGAPLYSTRTGLALLAFFVFACQCMSTVAAIRRETKSWRWPGLVLVYTYAVAWLAAFLVYQSSGIFGVR